MLNLIRVFIASRSCDTDEVIVNIEYEVMLTHKSTSNDHLSTAIDVESDAISICTLSVEVLTGIPVKRIAAFFILRTKLESNDRERPKEIIWPIRKFLSVI